ncbi:MAG TPA: BfmA/BtgA family mobilization protein [archaeon]|nr:BfmA/BtgA family mobilization protein [archaeon]
MQNEETTIRIKKTNKKRMAEIGRKDNSYDDILELLLEYYESNNKKKK